MPVPIETSVLAAIASIGSAQLDGPTTSAGWNGVTALARLNSNEAFCVDC